MKRCVLISLRSRLAWVLLLMASACCAANAQPIDEPPSDAGSESVSAADATEPRGSAASWSADLPVVSDGRHVWLWADDVDPDDQERRLTTLFHADASHRPPDGPVWEPVTSFTGRLAPRGAAADAGTLWLIFDDGKVSVVSLKAGKLDDHWYFRQSARKALPTSTTVRASVAAHGKLWVLARVETGQAIAELDGLDTPAAEPSVAAEDAEVFNLIMGLPRELPLDAEDPFADPAPATDQAASEGNDAQTPASDNDAVDIGEDREGAELSTDAESIDEAAREVIDETVESVENLPEAPAERLIVLDRGEWRVVPLPEGWEPNRPTQLIAPREAGQTPLLLVQDVKSGEGLGVKLYRPADGPNGDEEQAEAERSVLQPLGPSWTATRLKLPTNGGAVGLRIEQQLVLAQHTPTPVGFTAQLWAVRGDQLTAVGEITLDETTDTPAHGRWAAIPFGDAIGLVAGARETASAVLQRSEEDPLVNPAPGPSLAAVDLHGDTVFEAQRLDVEQGNALDESADLVILLGVVITSTVLLLTFWRRDPTANILQLPEGLAVADLMRRGFAGLIDIAPGLFVATQWFDMPMAEVYDRWPGRGLGATWSMMLPGVVAVGVIVGHTLVLEAVTGRSLGKWVTGLQVVTLTGERPKTWQFVVRGLLKTFDLIAYLLLILPIISPFRQRLGDMVARTVVVTPAAPAEPGQGGQPGDDR